MKGLLIVSALVACALARPDIGLNIRSGYQYQPPATSYGTPTGSYLPSNAGGQGQYQQSSSSQTFVSSGGSHQQPGHADFGGQTFNVADYARQGSGGFGSQGGFAHGGGFQQGQTQVHKHVYFYDSPEDLPAPTIRISGGASAAQKNYKIIFIKAPAYQAPQVPQIPVQAQNEEKTLVYVLVKKPDDAQDIVVPTLAPSKPSKPEVFFIKYKTQKEAEQHVQNIQHGASGGVSANSVENDHQFISTITDTKEAGGASTGHFGGHLGGAESHSFEASHTSTSVTSGGQGGQVYGPAGSSGPY